MYLHNCTYAKPDSTRSKAATAAAAAAAAAPAAAAAMKAASPWPTVSQKEARISAVLGIAPSECFQSTLEKNDGISELQVSNKVYNTILRLETV